MNESYENTIQLTKRPPAVKCQSNFCRTKLNFNMYKKIYWLSVIFFWLIASAISVSAQNNERFNIVFISIDDLNTNIGAYGDSIAITPNIDELADQGTLFNKAYVQHPICNPSRASILTGWRPQEIGVTDHRTHFRDNHPDIITLPQLFKNNGYQTIGLGKIFHWGSGFNDVSSWHRYHYEEFSWDNGIYNLPENSIGGKAASSEMADVEDTEYVEGKITEKAILELEKFKENQKPFFLAVGYFRPHLPYNAPKKYWDLYDRDIFTKIDHPNKPEGAPMVAFHNWQELRGYKDIPNQGAVSFEKQIELRHGYYASISYVDTQVGKLIKAIQDFGLEKNTIIVVWSDHGYHLGEQGLWAKTAIFEQTTRVPLIVSAPNIKQPKSTDAIVELLDLYPTLIDLTGIEPQGILSGKSLKPLLFDFDYEWNNVAYSQIPRPYHAAISRPETLTHWGYSVRSEDWRYTVWYNIEESIFEYPELYSMKNSDLERKNVAGSSAYAEVEKYHHKLIQEYVKDYY